MAAFTCISGRIMYYASHNHTLHYNLSQLHYSGRILIIYGFGVRVIRVVMWLVPHACIVVLSHINPSTWMLLKPSCQKMKNQTRSIRSGSARPGRKENKIFNFFNEKWRLICFQKEPIGSYWCCTPYQN